MMDIAHIKVSPEGVSENQTITDHLIGTAEFASQFASDFNNTEWGRLLGLWHALGKYSDEFQEHIKKNSGYEEGEKSGKTDHTSAAAVLAKEIYPNLWPPIAYCIAGHHAGLHNFIHDTGVFGDLSDRLKKHEFLDKIRLKIPEEFLEKINLIPPKMSDPKQMHLWIRMLFSCLVDADYLDTERFMNSESFEKRGKYDLIPTLGILFDDYMAQILREAAPTQVNYIRRKVYLNCINIDFHVQN
jgi:CRISPR-associated endonuclease/helicase Cas3